MAESAEPNSSDDDTVAQLHHQLGGRLRRLAQAMLHDWSLADDAVQDAFLLLAARSSEVPPAQRPGWLVRTVQYSALNLRRRRQRQQRLENGQWEQAAGVRERASEYQVRDSQSLEVAEELDGMRQAMLELPEAQQLIVRMRLLEDKTFQAIADELKLPLGTVLSRMRLAVEKLRSKLT